MRPKVPLFQYLVSDNIHYCLFLGESVRAMHEGDME